MSGTTQERIGICERLPEAKKSALTDFARFILAESDDARWDKLLDHPTPRSKLEASAKEPATPEAADVNPPATPAAPLTPQPTG